MPTTSDQAGETGAIETAVGHLRAGRLEQAEAITLGVLAARPDSPDALHILGVIATLLGRSGQAVSLIEKAIAGKPEDAALHFSLGNALQAQAEPGQAESAYRRALVLRPDYVEAQMNLAIALEAQGALDRSCAAYRRALEIAPDLFQAQLNLGNVLQELHLYDDAVTAYRAALRSQPDLPAIHTNLGNALLASGRSNEALAALRRAIEIKPDFAQAHFNLGAALQHLERLDDAMDAYREAIGLDPEMASAHYNLARVLETLARTDEAIRVLRHVTEIDPGHGEAQARLGTLLLKDGQPEAALALCDAFLAQQPGACGLLALKAFALLEAGRMESFGRLFDLERLIRPMKVDAVLGVPDTESLNRALAAQVMVNPTLIYEPPHLATRKGLQSGPLMAGSEGPLATLSTAISRAVTGYIHELAPDPAHPHLAAAPERWRLRAWVTILEAQGHQLPHIHPSAWLSGVYYVQLPATVKCGPADGAGAIEFGRPPDELVLSAEPPVRLVRPEEGLLVLFPSYLYHRTLPFESDQRRISIAFDVIPERP